MSNHGSSWFHTRARDLSVWPFSTQWQVYSSSPFSVLSYSTCPGSGGRRREEEKKKKEGRRRRTRIGHAHVIHVPIYYYYFHSSSSYYSYYYYLHFSYYYYNSPIACASVTPLLS